MRGLESVRREVAGLWAGGAGKTLLAIALGWGLLNGTRMIYPVLLPELSDAFGLTLVTGGFLVSLIWLCYAIGQVPGGVLADRYGERRVLTASVTIVVLGVVLVLFAPTALVLFAATGVVGLGLSQYPIARITALSDLYPDRIGGALGITMASGDVGQTVLPPIATVLAGVAAWQLGLGYVLPLLVLVAIVLWVTVPPTERANGRSDEESDERTDGQSDERSDEKPNDDRRSDAAKRSDGGQSDDDNRSDDGKSNDDGPDATIRDVLPILRTPTFGFMWVILFLFIFVWQTFSAFYPTYLMTVKGFSPAVAGSIFGLFFAFGVVVKPLAGVAYDRVGLRRSLPIVLGGAIVGLAVLPATEGFWPIVGVTVLIATMLGSGAITQAYLADAIPREIQGTGLGIIRSSGAMLGATGPVIFGAVAERGFFDEGYVALAGIVALVTVLTLLMPDE